MPIRSFTKHFAACGALFLTLSACDRLRQRGRTAAHEVHQTLRQTARGLDRRKEAAQDWVFPQYDAYEPDTRANKKRFVESLHVPLTGDVSNIYAYGDFLGADYKVLLAFTCDASTVDRIVRSQGMTASAETTDDGLGFGEEFPWWDKARIATLRPFKTGRDSEYWHYLWYDTTRSTAYYEEYSL